MGGLNMNHRILLDILSNELFNSNYRISGDADWQAVFNESTAQAVQILTYQECKGINIPEYIRRDWEKQIWQLISNNMRVNYEHSELHEILSSAGVPYVILKGSVSSDYYPVPMHRIMGDVDFLIRKADIEKVNGFLVENGFTAQPSNHECEIAYHRDQSVWELHWKVNGVPGGENGKIIQSYLDDLIEKAVRTENGDGGYMRPSDFHHGLVMLLHVARHLVTGGVGLRHLCDWAVFVAQISDGFPDLFEDKLKKVGLWRFAQILTQLSTTYLGCPVQKWQGEADEELLSCLILDIFAGGNFGHKDPKRGDASRFLTSRRKGGVNNDSVITQSLWSANEIVRRHWPNAEKYIILYPIGWGYFGIRYFIRMIMGKRPQIPVKALIKDADGRRELYKELDLFEVLEEQKECQHLQEKH